MSFVSLLPPKEGFTSDMSSTTAEFRYDVFVSYARNDLQWVQTTLLPRLEAAHLRVALEFRDFTAGSARITETERVIQASRRTLLVITPAYLESEWTVLAGLMAQSLSSTNGGGRLVPLLRQPANLPLHIRYLTYVDFTDPGDIDNAWIQLLTSLGGDTTPPPVEMRGTADWRLVHPYPLLPNFTGRLAERQMLSQWLEDDRGHSLMVLRALGGFGKSALAWYWLLHDVDQNRWHDVLWWDFYESDARFGSFLEESSRYFGSAGRDGMSERQMADQILRRLRHPGSLLILDGFERELRGYSGMAASYQADEPLASRRPGDGLAERDCVNPSAEYLLRAVCSLPSLLGKVLLTTRMRPRVVEGPGNDLLQGCLEREIVELCPKDAVEFCRAQGVRGTRSEIQRACEHYGYHPLSLRLLAGLIVTDLEYPGDIAVARRLDVSGDLVRRRHHVLEQAYEQLAALPRQVLGTVSCLRAAVTDERLRALLADQDRAMLNATLRNLMVRGLLHHDRMTRRYDLHPIVRRFAYDRFSSAERLATHQRLRDYFVAIPPPEELETFDDLGPTIELYHQTVRAGLFDDAQSIFERRLIHALWRFGAYDLALELLLGLFPNGNTAGPRLSSPRNRIWTVDMLSQSYRIAGQYGFSLQLAKESVALERDTNNKYDRIHLAQGLELVAGIQLLIGAFRDAEPNILRAIKLARLGWEEDFYDYYHVHGQEPYSYMGAGAIVEGNLQLSLLRAYQGRWSDADAAFADATPMLNPESNEAWSWCVQLALQLARAGLDLKLRFVADHADAKTAALVVSAQAVERLTDDEKNSFAAPYIEAHWLLGAAQCVNGDLVGAEHHLSDALNRCRAVNRAESEPNILLELARLRVATSEPDEARRLAGEALIITERANRAVESADLHLLLSALELGAGNRSSALDHAIKARVFATCGGPPDYTYKLTYDAAVNILEGLGTPVP